MKIKELINVLDDHRVFIQTHNCPDPDAIASAFGLQMLLRHFGVESTICYDGKLEKLTATRMIEFFNINIKHIGDIPDMNENDYIITVDAQKYNKNLNDFIGDEVACIDHHPKYNECEYKYSDIRLVGACSSIIAEYYIESGVAIPTDVATALTYGIKMDTLDFRRGVTPFDIDMYGHLFNHADIVILNMFQINTMEFEDLHAYGAAIQDIRVYGNIGIAFIPFNCPDALIAMVSDFILALNIIELSVIYACHGDGYKFSVRSEIQNLDAGKIVSQALEEIGSGGGHASFAGGFVPKESIQTMGDDVHNKIRERFVKIAKGL